MLPSLQENLSNIIMESLACAIPVVGFDVGGNCDMIEHKKNGYLVNSFDSVDFANGIDWVVNSSNYEMLKKNARKKILKEYDSNVVVKKYIDLYKKVLNAMAK